MTHDPTSRCVQEVVELHSFFEQWFNATLPNSEVAFARFATALAPTFEMVTPDGKLLARDAVLGMVRSAHASSRSDDACRIWIENPTPRLVTDETAIVTYEEWQTRDGMARGRRSTALFRANPAAPNGVEWLHVHETWLPEASG